MESCLAQASQPRWPRPQNHLFARLHFKRSFYHQSCVFLQRNNTRKKGRVESLNTAVLTESLHFKSLYKWFFTTLRAPRVNAYPICTHFRQPYLDVPGSRVTTMESRGNLILPVIPESMHGMLSSPGIYSHREMLVGNPWQ